MQVTQQVKLNRIKKLVRPDVDFRWWTSKKHASLDMYKESPLSVSQRSITDDYFKLASSNLSNKVDVWRAGGLSEQIFEEKYDKLSQPVNIQNLVDEWPAMKKWNFKNLLKDHTNTEFQVGTDKDGYAITITMKEYLEYMKLNTDDDPLYIYEERPPLQMQKEYNIPGYFQECEKTIFDWKKANLRRPPHRWFIMGPVRSGSSLHIDPFHTNAWNALVFGRKRWVLFPPTINGSDSKRVLTEMGLLQQETDGYDSVGALDWMLSNYNVHKLGKLPFLEITQCPGDVIFVPSKWWHVVLNLEDSVSITQNYVSKYNVNYVLAELQKEINSQHN